MKFHYSELFSTYSIVARDPETGEMGVAVQTHQMSVGRMVPFLLPGVGAIATQSLVNVSFGPIGLAMLREGVSAAHVVTALVASDENAHRRQLAVVDSEGRAAAHTGSGCIAAAQHHVGEGYSVQANMMTLTTVIPAMVQAYENASGDVAQRMVAALEAAQAEDGDIRGMQSAALKVVSGDKNDVDWKSLYDLRVDEHATPVVELARLVRMRHAQRLDEHGYELLNAGNWAEALALWAQARAEAPELEELAFWQAVQLADSHADVEAAVAILRPALANEPRREHWIDLIQRLGVCGIIEREGTDVELMAALKRMTPIKRTNYVRALVNVFVALIGAYGLSVTGFLVLRLLVGQQWTIIEIFNSFAHLLFMPAFALIPLCLLMRRFQLIVVLIPPVVAFLLSYSVFFTPRSSSAPPDAPQIDILTYNLKSQTENLDFAIAVMTRSDADAIALQELSEEASAVFAETFAESYPYQALHPQPGEPIPGQGMLSRYPITSDEYWRMYLGHQKVTLEINDRQVTLYNTHPIHPLTSNGIPRRAEEISELLNRAVNDSGPLIIVGDFNMTDQSADYWRITERYTDTYREIGWGMGFTFPDFSILSAIPAGISALGFIRPLARIDYIFHNDGFQAVEAHVWPSSGGSDHRPLRVTLALVGNSS